MTAKPQANPTHLPKQIDPGVPFDDEAFDAQARQSAADQRPEVPAPKAAARDADEPRVLMLGWEFPPHITGGLGTACYGLVRALSDAGTDVTFVLPRPPAEQPQVQPTGGPQPSIEAVTQRVEVEQIGQTPVRSEQPAELPGVTLSAVGEPMPFGAYDRPGERFAEEAPRQPIRRPPPQLLKPATATVTQQFTRPAPLPPAAPVPSSYAGDLFEAVEQFAAHAQALADRKTPSGFDVVHAHDWLTVPAAARVAAASQKPLVLHVHSTEFDRSPNSPDARIVELERQGVHRADRVLAVSHQTKRVLIERYGANSGQVEVIHNAIDVEDPPPSAWESYRIQEQQKIVLFLGRITDQKGPEYFVRAAAKVLTVMPDAKFVMAGGGDKLGATVEEVAQRGLGGSVLFTGFLRGGDVEAIFKKADVYVMPSVSEPFGIAPLEAMSHDVPTIVSRSSGVAEVLRHALKVDFWDTDEMANKIIAVLRRPPLAGTLRREGALEVRQMRWRDAATAVRQVYRNLLAQQPKAPATTSVAGAVETETVLRDRAPATRRPEGVTPKPIASR